MDVSEEMEEIRENLYELIKKNFPRGVASEHLAKKYHQESVIKSERLIMLLALTSIHLRCI